MLCVVNGIYFVLVHDTVHDNQAMYSTDIHYYTYVNVIIECISI